jgi:hypothetical protein
LESRPKYTALQNIQNLFNDKPVVIYEKHRIRMDEIANMDTTDEEEKDPGHLFK